MEWNVIDRDVNSRIESEKTETTTLTSFRKSKNIKNG